MADKIWAHSGDSHFLEPEDLWHQILPAEQAERMPRSEKVGENEEIVHVDGKSFHRKLPKVMTAKGADGLDHRRAQRAAARAPRDPAARLKDLDEEGVWGEVMYSSIGLWSSMIEDPAARPRSRPRARTNGWCPRSRTSPPTAWSPPRSCRCSTSSDAVPELSTPPTIGLNIVSLPTGNPPGTDDYNHDSWEPLWAAAEEAGMVIGFHIGTDGGDQATAYRGPGGAVLNYVDTTYGGQKAAMKLVTGGALDRHPDLKVLISEGGATWVPFIGDRMNEGYRQHGMFVRPQLSTLPKEILYRQVYASFQHDESAPAALWAMGYHNVMWGSDYPHLEGTYGHTQKTLHELFDDVAPEVRQRITRGAFEELFPHVSAPPA